LATEAYADAVETIPMTLLRTGLDPIDIMVEARALSLAGVNGAFASSLFGFWVCGFYS
jgi:chaperonin GroEL (HSP60 family)